MKRKQLLTLSADYDSPKKDLLTGTLTDYIFSVIVTVLRFCALFVLRDTARVRNMTREQQMTTREQQMTSPQLRRATLDNILATYIKGGIHINKKYWTLDMSMSTCYLQLISHGGHLLVLLKAVRSQLRQSLARCNRYISVCKAGKPADVGNDTGSFVRWRIFITILTEWHV